MNKLIYNFDLIKRTETFSLKIVNNFVMKQFVEIIEELEEEEEEKRVFNGGKISKSTVKNNQPPKRSPVFGNTVKEDGVAMGGGIAPAPTPGPGGAPGPILGPGQPSVLPCVINGEAPSGGCPHPHRPGSKPPPPFRRYDIHFRPISTVVVKRKKSKKRKHSRKSPKNPYTKK